MPAHCVAVCSFTSKDMPICPLDAVLKCLSPQDTSNSEDCFYPQPRWNEAENPGLKNRKNLTVACVCIMVYYIGVQYDSCLLCMHIVYVLCVGVRLRPHTYLKCMWPVPTCRRCNTKGRQCMLDIERWMRTENGWLNVSRGNKTWQ